LKINYDFPKKTFVGKTGKKNKQLLLRINQHIGVGNDCSWMQFYIATFNQNICTIYNYITNWFCICNISANYYLLTYINAIVINCFVLYVCVLVIGYYVWYAVMAVYLVNSWFY